MAENESKETTVASEEAEATETEDLRPKPPARHAPRGIRTFTVHRKIDETGVSGEGVIIEGVLYATGQVVLHWLNPVPRGSIAIFESMNDFLSVHIGPHPANATTITFEDGEQMFYGQHKKEEDSETEAETE